MRSYSTMCTCDRAFGDAARVVVIDETGFLKKAAMRRVWPDRRVGRRAVLALPE
jgi:hypothetical protein